MDWTEGYVTDLLYTYGFYQELNPLNARFLSLVNGIACRKEFKTACELGFGQGMSVNIHACASKTDWYVTDFNPSQVDFARTLASDSGFNNFWPEVSTFCKVEMNGPRLIKTMDIVK